MRARWAFALLALLSGPSRAGSADEISWIRFDNAPGWTAPIPSSPAAAPANASTLKAPVWFAKFPAAKIPLTPGGTFDADSARGKVLLIDYWASWCAPCRKELPYFEKVHAKHEADGLIALAINADEDAATAESSAKQIGLTMKIGTNQPELHELLGVRSLPTLFLVDKQGRIRVRWDGYRTGLEQEVETKVTQLLADDPSGTTKDFATVYSGQGTLAATWFRDLPQNAEGVVAIAGDKPGSPRVVASSGDELYGFDAHGDTVSKLMTEHTSGRLQDLGKSADGTRELLGYHLGATTAGVITFPGGDERAITVPAPILGAALADSAGGSARRFVFATLGGAAEAKPGDGVAKIVGGTDSVRSVAATPDGSLLMQAQDGTITRAGKAKAGSTPKAESGTQLLATAADGSLVGPRSIIAAVSGKFLGSDGRQIAVATYSGRVVLLDAASGKILFDSQWTSLHDLAAGDLDGDGREELLVAAGHSIVALGAPAH